MTNNEHCEACLNIRYDLPDQIWQKIPAVYEKLPGWLGFGKDGFGEDGIPYWFGYDGDVKTISASVEPSGLQLVAKMLTEEWERWLYDFKKIATEILGFTVGEIEDGEGDHY